MNFVFLFMISARYHFLDFTQFPEKHTFFYYLQLKQDHLLSVGFFKAVFKQNKYIFFRFRPNLLKKKRAWYYIFLLRRDDFFEPSSTRSIKLTGKEISLPKFKKCIEFRGLGSLFSIYTYFKGRKLKIDTAFTNSVDFFSQLNKDFPTVIL